MPAGLEIEIQPLHRGADGLRVRLNETADRAHDPRRALASVIKSFISVEQRQFATEGEYSGGWQELAPSTQARKAQTSLDAHILQATRRLRDSLSQPTHPDADIRIVGNHEVRLATRVFYAVFHRRGTRRMPARNPVEITPEIRLRWLRKLQHFIVHGTEL